MVTTTLYPSLIVLLILMVFSFFYGLLTKNYSTVDRLWSVLPPILAVMWLPLFRDNPRYLIAAVLVVAWGARLTRNFALKGGYRWANGRFTGEDYRWQVLREKITHPFLFQLFNLFFISIFQLSLVFGISYPLYAVGAMGHIRNVPLNSLDYILFGVFVLLLVLETVADEQQFSYYSKKRKMGLTERDRLGFNTYGLWSVSRHPNYVCEMGQWIAVSFFPVAGGGDWFPSGVAAVVLVALFAGSTRMAESITVKKYARYREWQKITPVWLPLPFKANRRDFFG